MANEELAKRLVKHAKNFGPLMDRSGNVNVEYLAGIEIICNQFQPLGEKEVITITETKYPHYESNGCDCGQVWCPICGG